MLLFPQKYFPVFALCEHKSLSQQYSKSFKANLSMHSVYSSITGVDAPQSSSKIFYRIRPSGKRFEIINFTLIMGVFFYYVDLVASLMVFGPIRLPICSQWNMFIID